MSFDSPPDGTEPIIRLERPRKPKKKGGGSVARVLLWIFFLFLLAALEIKLRLWGLMNLQDQLATRLTAWGFLFLVFFALDRLLHVGAE